MGKYNVQVQIIALKLLKKRRKNLFVKGSFRDQDKTCQFELNGNEAFLTSGDSCLVLTELKILKTQSDTKDEVTVTICTEKKTLGCMVFDLQHYISRVSNGKGDFPVNSIFEKKGLAIDLVVIISKVPKRQTIEERPEKPKKPLRRKETGDGDKSPSRHVVIKEEEDAGNKKKKARPTKSVSSKRTTVSPRKRVGESGSVSLLHSVDPADLSHRKDNGESSESKSVQIEHFEQILRRDSDNSMSQEVLSPSKIQIPIQPAHRYDTNPTPISPVTRTFSAKRLNAINNSSDSDRPKGGRLVERDKKENTNASKNGKYATTGSTLCQVTSPILSPRVNVNTLNTTGNKDIDVAKLKQDYKRIQDEAAEKYLVELIMDETTRDSNVMAYIIWNSLLQWDSFSENNSGVYKRILMACTRATDTYNESRTIQTVWLGIYFNVLYLAEEMKSTIAEEMPNIQDFISNLQSSTSTNYNRVFNMIIERLDIKALLGEYLYPDSSTKSSEEILEPFWNLFTDMINSVLFHLHFEVVKKKFLSRILNYLTTSVLNELFQQGCSYSVGIQVKMFVTGIEKWGERNNLNKKISEDYVSIIETELEPMRQAANLLCLSQKADLLKKEVRESLCSLLRPSHIAKILNGYHPDNFDKNRVEKSLIDKIIQQESTYTILPTSYNPELAITPLEFPIVMEKFSFGQLEIPKVILDKPAFSFLKKRATKNGYVITEPAW